MQQSKTRWTLANRPGNRVLCWNEGGRGATLSIYADCFGVDMRKRLSWIRGWLGPARWPWMLELGISFPLPPRFANWLIDATWSRVKVSP